MMQNKMQENPAKTAGLFLAFIRRLW